MREIEMSTRCSILIEIPDDLIGQTVKYQRQDNELDWDKNIDKTEPVKIIKNILVFIVIMMVIQMELGLN